MILCHGYNPKGFDPGLDGLIEFATHSPWEHAAMVIRDPWWLKDSEGQPLTGLYVYQSGSGPNGYPDVLNGNLCGVTFNRLYDFLQIVNIYMLDYRKYVMDIGYETKFVEALMNHMENHMIRIGEWLCTGIDSFFVASYVDVLYPNVLTGFGVQLW